MKLYWPKERYLGKFFDNVFRRSNMIPKSMCVCVCVYVCVCEKGEGSFITSPMPHASPVWVFSNFSCIKCHYKALIRKWNALILKKWRKYIYIA